MESCWLSGKENVPGAAVSKKGHVVTVFWDLKGDIIDFLDKGAIIKKSWQNSPYLLNDVCVCVYIYIWFFQVFIWVVWLLYRMNSERNQIFLKYFWPQLKQSLRKWQSWVIYIHIKNKRKNELKGNLSEKRISGKSDKGILEYGCYIQSWFYLRKVC